MTYGPPRRIGLRSCPETAKDSTAFGSTIHGASASRGGKETPTTWESRIIAERSMVMTKKKLAPVHPGEGLLEEVLKPMGLSQNRLALSVGVHPRRINEVVLGKRRVTAETALRLARYFGTSPQFWLGLPSDYDLDVVSDEVGSRVGQGGKIHAGV